MPVFAGELTEFALPAVLHVLADNAKTGLLEVVTAGRRGGVELVDGDVRAASVDRRRVGLARRLLASRVLDATILLEVLEAQGPFTGEHHLADQLVRGGYLQADVAAAALREHTIDAVLQMVRSTEGSFHLRSRRVPDDAALVGTLPAAEVIDEVARRQRRIDGLTSADLPLHAAVAVVAPSTAAPSAAAPSAEGPLAEASVAISAGAWRLLALLDGRCRLAELFDRSGLGVETTYRHLAELLDAGVVTDDPAAATPGARDGQRLLDDLEERWAGSERGPDETDPSRSSAGSTAPSTPAPVAGPVGRERTATVTELASRGRQQHRAVSSVGIDEDTLRRLLEGVEALP